LAANQKASGGKGVGQAKTGNRKGETSRKRERASLVNRREEQGDGWKNNEEKQFQKKKEVKPQRE